MTFADKKLHEWNISITIRKINIRNSIKLCSILFGKTLFDTSLYLPSAFCLNIKCTNHIEIFFAHTQLRLAAWTLFFCWNKHAVIGCWFGYKINSQWQHFWFNKNNVQAADISCVHTQKNFFTYFGHFSPSKWDYWN